MDIDKKTVISAGCEIRSPWNVHMGNCIIAGNCIIDGRSGIIIEDNVRKDSLSIRQCDPVSGLFL